MEAAAAMEADIDKDGSLDFEEYCGFIRNREEGEHTEEELRKRFNELDADGSGRIDMNEYLQWSLRDALARSATRIVDLFRMWDEDKSGSIEKNEFFQAIKALGFKIEREDSDKIFRGLDADNSGTLELSELAEKLKAGHGEELTKHQLQRAPTQKYSGRDAKCTRKNMNANYVTAHAAVLPETVKLDSSSELTILAQLREVIQEHRVTLIDLFREWDDDGNGGLDKKEFRRAIATLGYEAPPSTIDAVFASIDDDGCVLPHASLLFACASCVRPVSQAKAR